MIANLIGGFVTILIGVSLIGPIATQVNSAAESTNASGSTCLNIGQSGCSDHAQLYISSSWAASVLQMVPGFFALGLLGVGIAVTYSSLRQAGVV